MNFEFLILNLRHIQFLLYGMLLMFVIYSCKSAPTTLPAKLDLSEERQLVEEMKNLDPDQKTVILQAFDKADTYSESIRIYARELEVKVEKLEKEVAIEREDARAYRLWRNWIIGVCLAVVFGTILWQFKDSILLIARKAIIPL